MTITDFNIILTTLLNHDNISIFVNKIYLFLVIFTTTSFFYNPLSIVLFIFNLIFGSILLMQYSYNLALYNEGHDNTLIHELKQKYLLK